MKKKAYEGLAWISDENICTFPEAVILLVNDVAASEDEIGVKTARSILEAIV